MGADGARPATKPAATHILLDRVSGEKFPAAMNSQHRSGIHGEVIRIGDSNSNPSIRLVVLASEGLGTQDEGQRLTSEMIRVTTVK